MHTRALAIDLQHEPVPATQVVSGAPTTGFAPLGELGGSRYGVWEMSPGAMSDVEADELFVVLRGAGVVEFVDDGRVIHLEPGSVCRLSAGDRTIWTVTETLRKIYIT